MERGGLVHSSFIFIFFGGSLISIQLPLTMVAPDRDKDPLSIFASGPGPCPHSCARPFFILSRRAIHRSIERRDATRRQLFFIFLKIQEEKTEKSESAEPSAGVLESCRLMKRNQNGRIGARRN
jgi:hypothetical protein